MRLHSQALIVGCNHYDHFSSIDGAESDADRIAGLLRDRSRGAFDAVKRMRSPTIAEVQQALAETAGVAAKSQALLFLYFSGHGTPGGREGVQIVLRDTRQDDLTFTALSLRRVVEVLAEHPPSASIIVLDLCYSGDHLSAAAELALNELWRRESALLEGHFILAACGPDEAARESLGGGKFTSLLLDQLEKIGQERPFDQEIAVETLASSIVNASVGVLAQRPTWTGISISRQVPFSRNAYWDPKAPRPPSALSFESIPESERGLLADLTRSYVGPMLRVGTRQEWADDATTVLLEVAKSRAALDSRRTMIARLVQAISNRVDAFGGTTDLPSAIETLSAGAVALGQCRALDGEEIRALAFGLAQLTERFGKLVAEWLTMKGWLCPEDGPAQIALAPIRFWDVVGQAALLGLACSVLRLHDDEQQLAVLITDAVRSHARLHRVEWAGQYPDISAALGYVAWLDKELARQTSVRLLEHYVVSAAQGRLPTPARMTPVEIGENLAAKYATPTTIPPRRSSMADEGPALFLLLLSRTGESPVSLNARVAKMTAAAGLGDYFLYLPESVDAQFTRTMSQCEVREWVRASEESVSKMLAGFDKLARMPLTANPRSQAIECLATYAAGRLYRNRTCFCVFTALAERLAVV